MGAVAPVFFEVREMPSTYDTERTLTREVAQRVEAGLPGVEVLAVELVSPQRFCVYVDHPQGVDHALCERVTRVLDEYRREYGVDVSSPGIERPLRRPGHFARVVGRKVQLKTERELEGRKRFRGQVLAAGERSVKVGVDGAEVDIPYEAIVRGNLIDEG